MQVAFKLTQLQNLDLILIKSYSSKLAVQKHFFLVLFGHQKYKKKSLYKLKVFILFMTLFSPKIYLSKTAKKLQRNIEKS